MGDVKPGKLYFIEDFSKKLVFWAFTINVSEYIVESLMLVLFIKIIFATSLNA